MSSGVQVWSSEQWREAAVTWLDTQLAQAGIERTGEVEQPHLRPWATALTAPTTSGRVWLKAAGPGTAFEVRLYELMHRTVGDRVLPPMAADPARGWIVLPDGGPSLRDRYDGPGMVGALADALAQYGHLQRTLAPHTDEMLALGMSDMRPSIMPHRFGEAIEAAATYLDDASAGLRDDFHRVVALRDEYARWCARLAESPVPASVDHNDLHPGNILVDGSRVRFYDWGDAVVAHPFACLLVPLRMVPEFLGGTLDIPAVLNVRDAYLEAFTDQAPHAELVEALELACRVAKAARVLTWHRAIRSLDETHSEYAGAPLKALRTLLYESYRDS